MSLPKTILSNLAFNETYGRKVLPYLKTEYFEKVSDQKIFELATRYIDTYNTFPTQEALLIEANKLTGLNEKLYADIIDSVGQLAIDNKTNPQWLLDSTEEFCKDQAIGLALKKSIAIVFDDKNKDKQGRGAITEILKEALSVSFDSHIGHDFLEDFEKRFDTYHVNAKRNPFDIQYFNDITKGGFPCKSLNIWLGGTNVGKTLIMCHCAASDLANGKNVLYITLEMGETGDPSISQRIDANLLDIALNELQALPKDSYVKKMQRLVGKTAGKLIIKEYPTASAGTIEFRHLLNELQLKKNFYPDVIYIDYLNICISSRLKYGANVGSYGYVKSIAEELRGMGQEFNVPIVTASQLNREGFASSDIGLEHAAESFGTAMTADFICVASQPEQLADLGQYAFKQLKNRYTNKDEKPWFVVGVDKNKMRLYDVESSAQEGLITHEPKEKSKFGGFT